MWGPPSPPGAASGQASGSSLAYAVTSGGANCSVDSGTGTVTGIAVGTCVVTLTVSKSGYDDFEATNDAEVVTGTMGAITWPGDAYASGDLTVPGTRALSNAPTVASPAGATVSYSSTDSSVCTVDPADGTVTAVDDGSCVVTATFSKTDYIDKSADHGGITVVDGTPDAPVAPSATSALGVNTISWTAPAANGDAITAYAVESDKADLGGNYAGTWTAVPGCGADDLSGSALVTTCDHGVLAKGDKYKYRVRATNSVGDGAWSATSDEVTVAYGTQSVTWADYAGSVGVGATRAAGAASGQVSGSSLAYAVTSGGANCSVDSGTGTVTGIAVGTCVVTLTVSKSGYDDFEATNDAEVVTGTMGAITWPGDAYASGDLTVPGTRALSNAPTVASPAGATVSYSSTDSSVCTVDPANGTVTAVDDGSCVVTATFGKTGYVDKTADHGGITVVDGTPDAPVAPSATSALGVNTISWTAPAANGDAITAYAVESDKADLGGNYAGTWTAVPGCGADDLSGSALTATCDHGVLSKGEKYKYRVRATNSVGDGAWSATSDEVTVAYGTQSVTWADYAGSVGVGATRAAGAASGQVSGSSLAYAVTSGGANCSVDSGTGTVTGIAVGTCVVTLTVSKSGYDDFEATNDAEVVTGTMGAITWPGDAYAAGDLTVPGTRALSNAPTVAFPAGATVSYSSTDSSVCTVDPANGTVTAVDDGSCVVTATFGKTGYVDKTADHGGITVVDGTPDAPAAPTATSALGVNTISWTAPAENGDAITAYAVQYEKADSVGNYAGTWTAVPGCGADDLSGSALAATCDHGVLSKGEKYKYRVRATNSVGDGAWSLAGAEITVAYGTQSGITWADYSGNVRVGATLNAGSVTGAVQGSSNAFSLATGETDCSVDSGSGRVTGRAVGTCVVVLTVTKAGYDDFGATHDVTVDAGIMGAITWPIDAYAAGGLTVPGTRALSNAPDGRLPGRSDGELLVDRFERLHRQSHKRDGDRRGQRALRGHGDLQQDGLHRQERE